MKLVRCPLSFAILVAALLACGQFPAQYSRIETNVIRSAGYLFEPSADAAPGDTLRVKLFLSGEQVTSVRWLVSYNHLTPTYGTDTVLDLNDIPALQKDSWLPDSEEVRFIIPDSVFFTTKSILPAAFTRMKASLPATMRSMTQQQGAALLKDFSAVDFNNPSSMMVFFTTWGKTLGVSTIDSSSIASLTAIGGTLATIFSIPAIIDADVRAANGDKLKIRGYFTVRYNRKFQNTPIGGFLPYNHNPVVRWVGVYKVKGNVGSFFPGDPANAGKFTLSYLYNDVHPDSVHDTVAIEQGYSYFLGADSGIATYALKKGDTLMRWDTPWITPNDTVLADTSLDRIHYRTEKGKDTFELETYLYDWQFQNLALDSVTMPQDSLMALPDASPNGGGDQPPIMRMLPPLDKKMTHAKIWVAVYDKLFGDYNRPAGFTIRTVDLYFKF
jgi:hypothetical protein